jgi:hypothetical protein
MTASLLPTMVILTTDTLQLTHNASDRKINIEVNFIQYFYEALPG